MSLNDPLANVMSHLYNCEKKGKKECIVNNVSKSILKTLEILKENKYIKDFEVLSNSKNRAILIKSLGNINKCGVIKPRFSFSKENFEMFEKRYLPAKDFGLLIVTTSKGIMAHKHALHQNIGGKLLAYCY